MDRKYNTDTILKEFWRDNHRFADLFNTVVFQGKQLIKPEDLEEADTEVSGTLEGREGIYALSRMRDVVKKTAFGAEFVILGLEHQKNIHYAMPLRTMLYDSLGYLKEYREISADRKQRRKKGKKSKKSLSKDDGNVNPAEERLFTETKEEFLSGFGKDDKLHPIITIVLYYGEKPWDGPRTLKDMLFPMPEGFEAAVPDYGMNLLEILDTGKFHFQNADVEMVFEISREIFRKNFKELSRKYQNMKLPSELAGVIGAITESTFILECREKGEDWNMCRALEEYQEQARMEGFQTGQEKTLYALMERGILSPEQAAQMLNISLEEWEGIAEKYRHNAEDTLKRDVSILTR